MCLILLYIIYFTRDDCIKKKAVVYRHLAFTSHRDHDAAHYVSTVGIYLCNIVYLLYAHISSEYGGECKTAFLTICPVQSRFPLDSLLHLISHLEKLLLLIWCLFSHS